MKNVRPLFRVTVLVGACLTLSGCGTVAHQTGRLMRGVDGLLSPKRRAIYPVSSVTEEAQSPEPSAREVPAPVGNPTA